MFDEKHEIQATQSCQTLPRGIKIGTFFYVFRRQMTEKWPSLRFHCWFFMAVTVLVTCVRLQGKQCVFYKFISFTRVRKTGQDNKVKYENIISQVMGYFRAQREVQHMKKK